MKEYRLKKFEESIFLVGFMASGKSTIGKQIAHILEKPFIDLDEYIIKKEGSSVSDIFKKYGELYFRNLEWKYLLQVIRNFRGVISLGGGALHNQQVLDHVKLYGLMVFLKAPLEVIVDRVSKNKERPIVFDKNGENKSRDVLFSELESLYSKRIHLYNQAQIILESTGKETKHAQAVKLIDKLNRYV
jgi:shikimate kinase